MSETTKFVRDWAEPGADPVYVGRSVLRVDGVGYCTPGMVIAAKSLLSEYPNPTEDEVRHYLAGNLCRCTGYERIVQAVLAVADGRTEPNTPPPALIRLEQSSA